MAATFAGVILYGLDQFTQPPPANSITITRIQGESIEISFGNDWFQVLKSDEDFLKNMKGEYPFISNAVTQNVYASDDSIYWMFRDYNYSSLNKLSDCQIITMVRDCRVRRAKAEVQAALDLKNRTGVKVYDLGKECK